MNFENINQELSNETLIIKPISADYRDFVNGMFQDKEISKYYIVPKEARQDYRRLIDYWFTDIQNGAGICWIIFCKAKGFLSKERPCGFIAFEFRDSLKNARISIALVPEFRRKGIATDSISIVIEKLKSNGIETVEADIDRENINSEKLVEKLGFKANKRHALMDPEMMRNGEMRMRTLWKKILNEVSLNNSLVRIPLNATIQQITPAINQIVEEINNNGQNPELLVRYFYLLGRIEFMEGNFEEAKEAFGHCNMINIKEGSPQVHENYYWFGRMYEFKGELENAMDRYELALEMFNDDPLYITKEEIEKAINRITPNLR